MQNSELIYYHAFNCAGGFGPQKFRKLLNFFPTLETAWQASREELVESGIGEKQTDSFISRRKEISPEEIFRELAKEDIRILVFDQAEYPPLLREIASAPPLIYLRGDQEILKNKSVAVVGSRKFTSYGERVAQNLCRDLVRSGLTIVSGLALGIDAISHRATLDNEGIAIAVLGTGIDDNTIYPRDNFNLARRILENGGALITEYPPKTPSLKQNFPARNRLMAGLTLGTLVIEAALESGSLITAEYALEFGREVFSVPGPIFSPQSEGTNFLIRSGAKLVQGAKDILEELRMPSTTEEYANIKIFEPQTEEEKNIWKNLSSDPIHVDRLVKLTKLNPAIVSSTLALMEIKGAIKNAGGQNYIKC